MPEELKLGDQIPANENTKKAAQEFFQMRTQVTSGIFKLLHAEHQQRDQFMETIRQQHPELEGYFFSYDHVEDTIRIIQKPDPDTLDFIQRQRLE